jgi:DNA-binding transcriptional regulator YhcF (GntR family)
MQPLGTPKNRTDAVTNRLRKLARSLGPGGKLPTFRKLMSELGVSQTTVAAAMRRLEAEGVTETRPGKGIFVALKTRKKPILLLCETAAFVSSSPFWEMLLEALTRAFRAAPDRLVIEFTVPNLDSREKVPLSKFVSSSLWPKLQARQFAAVIGICLDERLMWEIERFGLPVTSFGSASHHMVNMALDGTSDIGVSELIKLGCKKNCFV